MNSKEIAQELLEEHDGLYCSEVTNITKEEILKLQQELEILEILKPRIHLKDSKLKSAYFTIDEKGLPIVENDLKEVEVAFIEASGFVFKNSEEYKLLKEWLENDK